MTAWKIALANCTFCEQEERSRLVGLIDEPPGPQRHQKIDEAYRLVDLFSWKECAEWWVGEYPFAICGSHAREISEALE